ncbi:MAG: hypothetical protein JW723_01470 [Bacteroidales bacterium]|nr:hypothetical protein [Bacteroidales bacterium]
MKRIEFKLLFVFLSAFMLMLSSCEKDENGEESKIPVLNKDFSYTVDENDVTFTTSLVGTVIFKDCTTGTEYQPVDGSVVVNLPVAGTYPFICNTIIEGIAYNSDTFDVVITQSDLTYLESGLWLYLTGGHTAGVANEKTWRLDMNAAGKCVYFAGPLYYSGYSVGDDRREEWVYWAWNVLPEQLPYTVNGQEMTSFFNWEPDYPGNTWIMPAQDYGTITFDGVAKTVSTAVFGVTENGTFNLDPETWKLTITGVTLPIDTGRLNEGQYEETNLQNLRIFSLSDSAMQIGIKRSYEGGDESKWVNVYNFVCDDYDYPVPEEFTFEEAPKTSVTATDLVGTWKIGDVPMGWIGYTKVGDQGTTIPARLFEKWDDRTEVVATLSSWGLDKIDSVFTANDAFTYVFNGDGSCTLNGVANNYSVSNGIITFTTALTTEFSMVTSWLNHTLTGTAVTIIDVNNYGSEEEYEAYTPEGIWIGQKNGDKNEYSGFHLVKQ